MYLCCGQAGGVEVGRRFYKSGGEGRGLEIEGSDWKMAGTAVVVVCEGVVVVVVRAENLDGWWVGAQK